MNSVLVIHGPNLNLVGTREPNIYGRQTIEDINRKIITLAGIDEFTMRSDAVQS